MKIKNLITILLCFIIIALLCSVGNSLWTISYENNDASIKIDKTSKVIVENYIVNNGTEQAQPYSKFTDVAAAIRSANNQVQTNPNIKIHSYILPGSSAILENGSITLLSRVSLYLPYDGKTVFTDSESEYKEYIGKGIIDSSANNVNNYRKNLLTLNNYQLTISSGAEVYIGGELGTSGVVRNYSEILLGKNSKIVCSGNLYAYGYIKEKDMIHAEQSGNTNDYFNECDQERYLYFKDGGYLMTALGIADTSTGGTLKTLVDKKICPFTIFDFPNIQTYTKFVDGAKMDAKARIVVGSGTLAQYFSETVHIVDQKGGSGLFLTSPSNEIIDDFLAFEYCPRREGLTVSEVSSPTRVYINTNVDIGSLVIQASVVTIDTQEYFLPISYKIKPYVLSNATFTIGNKMKFMPGSEIVVLEDGRMHVDSSIIFYQEGDLSEIQGTHSSYSTQPSAQFMVNGTLKLTENGKIGAYIETTNSNGTALLDFELVGNQDSFMVVSEEGVNSDQIKVISSGPFINDDGTTSDAQFGPTMLIYSDPEGNPCWSGDRVSTYVLNITINNNPDYKYNIGNYQVYQADDINGQNEIELTSGSTDGNNSYDIQKGKYIKIVVTRAQSASFIDSTYIFDEDTYFKVTSNLNLHIIPNEGVSLSLYTQGTSGAGSTKYKVTETETGYTKEVTSNGEVILIKGSSFRYQVTAKGTGSTSFDSAYIARGTGGYYSSASDMTPEKYCESNKLTDMKQISTDYTGIADDNYTIFTTRKNGCIIEGTLVTMADGTKKKIEDLKVGDMVVIFNHETGKLDIAPVVVNVHDAQDEREVTVINLIFNNGSKTRISFEHGFFDVDSNEYVYINEENYKSMIGHRFYMIDGSSVTLTDAYLTNETVKVFSPVTYKHLTIFSDNLLSIGGDLRGLFNIFELDENMKIDIVKMNQDIEKYGLYTYDEWKEYLTYEQFIAFNVQYLKVSIGKGFVTKEEIIRYIESYL
ncbi:MAG: hypothetical protein NC182_07930 [Prevotella sp.]|nr:hypothetical protein [Staphylococcus sp.]MCM1351103.1 hypothetical protein [Prevotella sp.]